MMNDAPVLKTIQERVRGFKARRMAIIPRITQFRLAELAGVSRTSIARCEAAEPSVTEAAVVDKIDAALRELEQEVAHGASR